MSRCSWCLVVGPQDSWSLVASLAEVSARLHSFILRPADDDAGTDQDQHNRRRFIFIAHHLLLLRGAEMEMRGSVYLVTKLVRAHKSSGDNNSVDYF